MPLLFLFVLLTCSFSFAVISDNSLETNLNNSTSSKILAAGEEVKTTKLSQKVIWSSSRSVKNYVETYKIA